MSFFITLSTIYCS